MTLVPRASSPPRDAEERGAGSIDTDPDDPERYHQVGEHARGGLGRIVRAVDRRLGRTVAVKELLRHDGTHEARFLREAMITARLEHPGIVPVHEAGRWPNGDPYYVMKLVEGRTLKELICERRTLRDRLALLPHVIAIADAVGYAHSEGVIHRDLKPSNVIVGEFGETIVVDWGLARDRRLDAPEPSGSGAVPATTALSGSWSSSAPGASTVSGKVVGTPSYMSPEQARGEQVDERADVYAIGTVLYELLAGTPPHHDETPQATLDRVIAGPPRPLSCLVAHVPSELATIVAKAMARCPDDRYPNASSLAEDLRRFQCGKLVSAHSYTAWSLLRKKVAQHRGVFAVAIASALALGAVGVESFRRVVAERNIAEVARANADTASAQLRKRQRELVLLQAETALRKDPTATLAWLKEYAIGDEDRAHVLDVIDEALAEGVSRHVFRPGDWVHDAAFTSDDRMVVAASRDGVLRAFDLDTGIETALGRNPSSLEQLAMSPDGRFVVTAGALGEVAVWPLPGASGAQARVLSRGGRPVSELRFSRDGRRVLVTRERGPAEVLPLDGGPPSSLGAQAAFGPSVALDDWTRQVYVTAPNQVVVDDGDATRALARTDKAINRVAISPSGDTVLVYDGSTVWSVPFAGGAMRRLASYEGKMNPPVWSPDQRTVALTGGMHDILLVEVASGASRELRGHTDALYSVQWTRDGHRLLSASDDGTSRVWTVSDGTSIVLRGHDDDVYQARFSSDERQVVSSSLDGSIRVWQVEQPGSRRLVEGSPIDSMAVVADRALVKTATEVAWWNLSSGHRVPVFSWAQEPRSLGIASPSPDGEHLLVPGADWSIEVRNRKREPVMLRGHRSVISRVEFSRDSHSLYTSSFDGTLRKWNLETGASALLLDGTAPVRNFALGEDGRVVAQLGEPGSELSKLIAPDGTVSDLGERGDPRWCIAFAEFDRVRDRMLLRRCDRTSALLDGDRLVELPTDHYGVVRFAASPDGTRIAGALGDRTIRVWDATTGRVLETLRGHSDLVWDVAFSPDGQRIASASYDRTVRVWQSGRQRHRVLRGHSASVNHIAWKDGAHLVTGSRDGTLRVWDVPSVDLPTPSELAMLLRRATSARIDGDRPTSCDARRIGT